MGLAEFMRLSQYRRFALRVSMLKQIERTNRAAEQEEDPTAALKPRDLRR